MQQHLSDAHEAVRALSTSLKQLQSTQSAGLTTLQTTLSSFDIKLKGVKQLQETQLGHAQLLPRLLEPLQEDLKSHGSLLNNVFLRTNTHGLAHKSTPAQASNNPMQGVSLQKATADDHLRTHMANKPDICHKVDQAHVESMDTGHEMLGSSGTVQPMLPVEQLDGLQTISKQLQMIEAHLGIQQNGDQQSTGHWLSELQDLPQAALLMVQGMDTILQRLDEMKVSARGLTWSPERA